MSASPTFIATFADGVITRLSVHHPEGRKSLDLRRGVRLARFAYLSRIRAESSAQRRRKAPIDIDAPIEIPPIVEAKFVDPSDGDRVLATYTAEQLKDIT